MTRLPLFLGLFSFALLSGCGGGEKKGSIAGKVTLDGQPLESGSITFKPVEGSQGTNAGAAIAKGAFEISQDHGPTPGPYLVEIRGQRKTGKKLAAGSPFPPGTMVDETEEAIPSQYNTKSTLRLEVKPGKNHKDFELTTK